LKKVFNQVTHALLQVHTSRCDGLFSFGTAPNALFVQHLMLARRTASQPVLRVSTDWLLLEWVAHDRHVHLHLASHPTRGESFSVANRQAIRLQRACIHRPVDI